MRVFSPAHLPALCALGVPRWAVEGVASDGVAIDELVVSHVQGDGNCADVGVALLRRDAGMACGGDAAAVEAGVGVCGCGSTRSAVAGAVQMEGATTALWVRAPPSVRPESVVHAYCDLDTRHGGWTLVYSTAGDGGGVDGDNTATGLAHRSYAPGLSAVLASATEVLIAQRMSDGTLVDGTVVAAMRMPTQWRDAHPSSQRAVDLADWPVALDNELGTTPRTLRFGSGSVDLAATTACNGDWEASGSAHAGRVCVAGTSAPMWYGWASGDDADVCDATDSMSVACSVANAFTIAAR